MAQSRLGSAAEHDDQALHGRVVRISELVSDAGGNAHGTSFTKFHFLAPDSTGSAPLRDDQQCREGVHLDPGSEFACWPFFMWNHPVRNPGS